MNKKVAATTFAILGCVLAFVSSAQAQSLAQTFYVPVPAVEVRTWANSMTVLPENDTMHSVISITATASDTVLFYDHWEDGFETDITRPIQATTEIWGDRDCANGFTPTLVTCIAGTEDANDVIAADDVLILESDVPVPGGVRNPSQVLFDGSDKFAVTEFVAVTRAAWPSTGVQAQLGGAAPVFDTKKWGTEYEAPVGENTGGPVAFEFVSLSIMAEEDGTVVTVDLNADGTDDQTFVLNQGQSVLVGQVGVQDLLAGAKVAASSDVQVDILTANQNTTYEGRWYSTVPTSDWDTRYFSPVGSTVAGDLVHAYLYNPGTSSIAVAARQQSGCTTETVPAGGFLEVAIDVSTPVSAAEFSTQLTCAGAAGSNAQFFAVATIDRNETIHDWGFTLIPTTSLTPTAVVGWAPGSTDFSENASPVWVTAVDPPGGATTLYVDFDGDPTTGALTDAFGNGYDLSCTVNALESVRIFDGGGTGSCTVSPGDFDHTGMRIYTLDGTRVTAAWGQDPQFASSGQPQQLDMGTAVLPFSSLTAFKQGALLGDTNGNGGLDPGETIIYTIRVKNTGIIPVTDIDLLDTLDPNTTYVPGTTKVGGALVSDDTLGTPFPLDGSPIATGYPLVVSPGDLAPGESKIVTFVVTVNEPLPPSVADIVNQVVVSSDTETFVDADTTPLQRADLDVIKTSSAGGAEVGPGQTVSYTVTVTNSSPASVTGVRVSDPVPQGTSYVAGSTVAIGPEQIYVAERFETAAYDRNDGPAEWAGDWVETDNGGAGPAAGDVRVDFGGTSGELRIEDETSAIARAVDLSPVSGGFAMLSFDFSVSGPVDPGDFVLVQGSTAGTGGPFSTVPGGTFEGVDGDQNPMPSGRLAFDLSSFIGGGSAFRFDIPTGDYNGTDEAFFADNLELRAVGSGDSASDDFASGGYAGGADSGPPGTNWAGPWTEIDSAGGGAGGGEVLITAGEVRLGTAGNSLSRTVDLSGAVLAMLRFDWDTSGDLENDDELEVQVSTNGTDFTALGTFVNDPDGTRSYDLTPYISATTTVRFSVEQNTTGAEYFSIDNVEVLAGRHTSVTKDNSGGGNPQLVDGSAPNLVLPHDNFALAPGESMTVTFDAVVDDPINLPRIVNTVTVTAFENPDPTSSTTIDPVIVGGAVGDLVWLDLDGDGVYDIGEPGISGVRVWMDVNGDGVFTSGVDRQQTTDANGKYLFGNTAPGSYAVYADETTLPGALTISPGSFNPIGGIVITLADEQILDVDFGYTSPPATAVVGDFVWSDANGDGIQNPGEIGLGGVTLTLRGAGPDGIFGTGDDTTTVTTTDPDGSYLFAGVPPGDYRVEVSGVPAGYAATTGPQSEGGDISRPFTLAGSDVLSDVDFGYQNPALFSITDTVWFDTDTDGILGAAEDGIPGVTVNLRDSGGNLIGTTTTAADGSFTFEGLVDGADYTVEIGDTGGKLEGLFGTTTAGEDRSLDFTVAGADITGENFGYSTAGWIGDRIWSDANGNGVQDPGESGLGGVTLDLVDVSTGSVVASTTTVADGSYLFKNLLPGAYVVQVASGLPGAAVQTGDPTAPGVDCRPSNCDNESSAVIITFTSDLRQDFGYQVSGLADISGTVFTDPDRDGVLDSGEPGIEGVTLALVDAGPDGLFGTNDDLVVATTTAAADGTYSFPDVPDGSYQVEITDESGILEGYELTSGLDAINVTAAAGTDVTGVDFGYIRDSATGSIGDTVFFDADRDGFQDAGEPGISGVTVDLIDVGADGIQGTGDDGATVTTTTDANGNYLFSGLAAGNYVVDVTDVAGELAGLSLTAGSDPTAVIVLSEGEIVSDTDFGYASTPATGSALGDRVWYDANGNGVQDPGEVGIGGVLITVVGPSGTFTTTTDANGTWLLTGLAPGDYTVTVDSTTLPAGYDTVPTNGPVSRAYEVLAGEDLLTADFGFDGGATGTIGDTVYLDADGDGVFEPLGNDGIPGTADDEAGLEGVTLSLIGAGSDGILGTGDDEVLASTITDINGSYSFSGVPAGEYSVVVTDVSGVLADLNATQVPAPPITIPPAGGVIDTVDFGYAPSGGTGSIGDVVWHDKDGDGLFEPIGDDGIPGTSDDETGLQGVTLDLWLDDGDGIFEPFSGDDNFLRTVVTDVNGEYYFDALPPATYFIDLTDTRNVLDGFTKTVGPNPGNDGNSQAEPYTVVLTTAIPSDPTADFGYTSPSPDQTITGTVYEDQFPDAVQTAGEPGVAGVVVKLFRDLDGDGVLDANEPLAGTTLTDANGDYEFLDLPNGNYDFIVVVNPATTPVEGFEQTTQAATGGVQPVSLTGSGSSGNDFGFHDPNDAVPNPGAIGDRVWLDVDGDGVDDASEPGLSNVTLDVYNVGPDGLQGTADDFVVAATETDANGNYLFNDLPAGTFWVDVTDLGPDGLPGSGDEVLTGLAPAPGTTDPSITVTLTEGDIRRDIDFGYVNADPNTASIGDFIWSDANGDGIQDAGEPGIGGVTVTLLGAGADGLLGTADDTTTTTTTAADGTYLFTALSPGDYRVDVDETSPALTGYSLTVGPQSSTDPSVPITVLAQDIFVDADFGFRNPTTYSISDRLWHDIDADGVQDANEPGLSGVTIDLVDSNGFVIATTTTDASGDFDFSGLPDGAYTLRVSDSNGALLDYLGTTVPATVTSLDVVVAGADVDPDPNWNFGYTIPGQVGDTIFSDTNSNGVQDAGEPGLAGVLVELWLDDGDGVFDSTLDSLLSTTTTNGGGEYLFQSLGQGTYFVSVDDTQPELATATPTTVDQEVGPNAAGTQIEVTLAKSSESFLDADFGYNEDLADVSGTVFEDLDADGFDDGEPGLAGVTLELVDPGPDGIFGPNPGPDGLLGTADDLPSDDILVAESTSDALGNYVFTDVQGSVGTPRSYRVEVTDTANILDGYSLTSGLDQIPVTVAGVDVADVDFGYVQDPETGSIGDLVWHDADRDGVVDTGEPGLSGVTVDLIDVGPDGVLGTADDGGVVASTTTDANGAYAFADLPAGNYVVDVTDLGPDGLPANGDEILTGMAPTVGTTDPSSLISLSEGEAFAGADFGYASAVGSALGDTVWYDADGDGFEDAGEVGIDGVTVNLWNPGLDGFFGTPDDVLLGTEITSPDGSYLFTGVGAGTVYVEIDTTTLPAGYTTIPTNGPSVRPFELTAGQDLLTADFGFNGGTPGGLQGTVYFDGDGDSTQDVPGEVGIEFVTVNLVDPATGAIVATTTTNANGDYSFLGVPPGNYNVVVSDLSGIVSELNPTETPALPVVVAAGSVVSDVDFGYAPTTTGAGTIGDLVFHDVNGNGAFDPLGTDGIAGTADDESGFEDVTVELWVDVDGDGVITPGIDNLVRETTTDANGNYEFLGLPFDDYLVTVTDKNGVLDVNGNGIVDGDEWIQTAGVDPTPVTLDAATPSSFDADFGYQAAAPELVSGTVFFDFLGNGVLDPGDSGVAGAVLSLYRDLDGDGVLDPEDSLVGTTVSSDGSIDVDGDGLIDPAGFYAFGDLVEGDYLVAIDTSATFVDGLEQTTQQPGNPDEPVVVIAGACVDCAGNDFGFTVGTTRVLVSDFRAVFGDGGLEVHFETAAQDGTIGFYLYRWAEDLDDYVLVNQQMLAAAIGAPQGASYRIADPAAGGRGVLRYALVEIESGGAERVYGPFSVRPERAARASRFSAGDDATTAVRQLPEAVKRRLTKSSDLRQSVGRAQAEASSSMRPNRGRPSSRKLDRVKMTTADEGLYFVSTDALAGVLRLPAARITRFIELGRFDLTSSGAPVAWLAADGGAGLFFYGEHVASPYSDHNVYWLEFGAGKTMEQLSGGYPLQGSATTFVDSVHFERDLFPVTVLGLGSDLDFYYWSYVSAGDPTWGSASMTLDVDDPVSVGTATLTLDFQGASSTPAATDHQVVVSLNGVELGSTSWDGSIRHSVDFEISASDLINGPNQLQVTGVLGQGIPYSVFLVDSVGLTYERGHQAVGDELRFGTGNDAVVTVGGFTSSDVMVLEISDPKSPKLVVDTSLAGSGPYSIGLLSGGANARYLAASMDAIRTPLALEGRQRSKLRDDSGAEYVVVAPEALADGADALASYRQGYGFSTRVVTAEEIYDEFSHGLVSPEAIRDFLAFAHREWPNPVRFAVFAGAASFDYRNVQGVGDNLLPPLLTNTPYGLFATDMSFGDVVGGDGVPEIAIGRLPVLTNEEIVAYVDKLAAAESLGIGVGPGRVTMLADNDDGAGAFSADSDQLLPLLAEGTASDRIYLSEKSTAQARTELFGAVGEGVGLVNYLGHGGLDRFADEGLLLAADAPALVGGRLPVFTSLTCSVGRHEVPGWTSLAEALVLEPGAGAAAVFAPSGQSVHQEAVVLNDALFRAIFETRAPTIGEAVNAALADYSGQANLQFMLEIYNLLGDPAYRLW